jgi:formate dehydrogenase subunit gamma
MGTMTSEGLRQLIAPHAHAIGGPLTALRALQEQVGWIDADSLAAVADVFNLSRAEVRGLAAFYPDFRTRPPARHLIRVCQAEACQAVGGRELTRAISARLGADLGGTSPDGEVELGAVYCLGLCARGPAMVVDGELVVGADATVERILDGLGHG